MHRMSRRIFASFLLSFAFSATTAIAATPNTTVDSTNACPQEIALNTAVRQDDIALIQGNMNNAKNAAQTANAASGGFLQTCLANMDKFNFNGILNGLDLDNLLAALESAACNAVTSEANQTLGQMNTSYVVPGTAGIVGGSINLFGTSNTPIQTNTQTGSQRAGQCIWQAVNKTPC